jgi:nicotinamidase-related amidase
MGLFAPFVYNCIIFKIHKGSVMKPALLVIDVQKDFFNISPECAKSLDDAIENINLAIAFFHKKGLPVFCVQHMDPEDNLIPGTDGFDIPESLKITPTDLRIHKTYGNAFNKTPLAGKLTEMGVDTVFITGFCAEYCVLSTIRGAMDLDLTPIIIKDCLASATLSNIRFVEDIHDLVTIGAMEKMLG